MSVTYDAGALLAAEADQGEIEALHARVLARGQAAGRASRRARPGEAGLRTSCPEGCRVEDLTEQRSRAAGAACARSGARDVIDASVVVRAPARDALVVISDPYDLARIADGLGRGLRVIG